MPHPVLSAVLAVAFALCASTALAQAKAKPQPDKVAAKQESAPAAKGLPTENFHAQCIGCHGIPGYKTAFPETYHVPKIAGQQPAYIIAALKAYKSGERSHPSMRGIAASLTEEHMKALADFYGAPTK
jgi:cytochrome c553